MAEPFIGQIIAGGWNFAPRSYATCDGQILSIAQNTALFSLLGTTFGGNGQTTFALPDLRGRVPIHMGQGPGLSSYSLGQVAGEENHTLILSEMPAHNHMVNVQSAIANQRSPVNNFLAMESQNRTSTYNTASGGATLNAQSISAAGSSQPHNNIQPYLVINFCIALEGIFPSRN
ncbi:MAG TPA: tail fiber protein [Candidatus Kapabacteria bacterium]|nr:tail fiber protein [Candidatus Kapabacteria bacterium]